MDDATAYIATWDYLRTVHGLTATLCRRLGAAEHWRKVNERSPFDFGYDDEPDKSWSDILRDVVAAAQAVAEVLGNGDVKKNVYPFAANSWKKLFQEELTPIESCEFLCKLAENLLLDAVRDRKEFQNAEFWTYQKTMLESSLGAIGRAMTHMEHIPTIRSHALRIARSQIQPTRPSAAEPAMEAVDANPPATTGTEAPATTEPAPDPLPRRQKFAIAALYKRRAFSADSRITTAKVASEAEGNSADPESYKRPIACLRRYGFANAIRGPEGGVWLTQEGREYAESHGLT